MNSRRSFISYAVSSLLAGTFVACTSAFANNAASVEKEILTFKTTLACRVSRLSNPYRWILDFKDPSLSLISQVKSLSLSTDFKSICKFRFSESKALLRLVFESNKISKIEVKPSDGLLLVQINYSLDLLEGVPVPQEVAADSSSLDRLPPSSGSEPNEKSISDKSPRSFVLVLDPGHGGKDPGAIGLKGLKEKAFTLALCKKIKENLSHVPNLKVVLTREKDEHLSLRSRVRIAQRQRADLFISVHADAFLKRSVRGASAYVLSNSRASSVASKWLASQENSVDDEFGRRQVFISDLERTLADLTLTAKMNDSLRFGDALLKDLSKVTVMHKKELESAGFAVLTSMEVPSVLLEAAFISNPEDELKLKDPKFIKQLSKAISQSCLAHFRLSARV